MPKRNEAEITGEIDGEISLELKKEYAKYLAKILITEYGKKECEKMLMNLKQAKLPL